jgi:hypothetical protein
VENYLIAFEASWMEPLEQGNCPQVMEDEGFP